MSTEPIHDALSVFLKVKEALESKNGVLLGFDEDNQLEYEVDYRCENEGDDVEEDNEDSGDNGDVDKNKNAKIVTTKVRTCLKLLITQAPFAIGGEERVSNKEHIVKMCLPEDISNDKSFVEVGSVCNLSVKSVLQFCEPSPFGDLVNQETKIDPSVRLAMECKADRIVIERNKNKVFFEAGMMRAIKTNLLVDCYPHIELVLNKLNVYSEFGHFKPHTDTPTHDPSKFLGSVVVCLPTAHEGGELVVRHAGEEIVFDFAKKSDETDKIQFAAFYGNCEHEVRPVTAGHRITLTYSILVADSVAKEPAHYSYYYSSAEVTQKSGIYEPETRIPRILNETLDALQSALSTDRHLGVFLSHHYTHSGLMATNLKAADKLLYDYLVAKSVPVSLVPVVSRYAFSRYDGEYSEYNDRHEAPDVSVRLIGGFADSRIDAHKHISNNIPFISSGNVDGVCIEDYDQPCAHTGNEVEPHSVERVYIKAAMIIGPIPSSESIVQDDAMDVSSEGTTADITTTVAAVRQLSVNEEDGPVKKSRQD